MTPALQPLLQTAVDAALAASVCIRKYFGSADFGLQREADGSPVTLADQEAEAVIRRASAGRSIEPLDILGEEEGLSGTGTRYRWTVDPIDGTRSFVRGIPLFGSMIGLRGHADEQRASRRHPPADTRRHLRRRPRPRRDPKRPRNPAASRQSRSKDTIMAYG